MKRCESKVLVSFRGLMKISPLFYCERGVGVKLSNLNKIENCCVFVSDADDRVITSLDKIGISIIPTVPNSMLIEAIMQHADCMLFNLNGNYFIDNNNYENIVKYFTRGEDDKKTGGGKCLVKVNEIISSPYPGDVRLNAKTFGRYILCNETYISDDIKNYALSNSYIILHCNQGYAACSTVKLNDKAAITDDESVYNTLIDAQIDCILVSKGSVKLKGFNYGFIGGCCGMVNENILLFAGELEAHNDSERIINHLNKYHINYINLFSGELVDIGGIIELK